MISPNIFFPQLSNENYSNLFLFNSKLPQVETTKIELNSRVEIIKNQMSKNKSLEEENYNLIDRIGESARNRFGRPYISGRPLLLCDRKKIISLYKEGKRKIAIAREIGITHSCVSKVIRRFEETGDLVNKNSRTASCACPGEAETHGN
ncbi:Paired domain-containing protein [Meloidogyne graminicola]|uniref:Paired domain-containing protein n=1 Tax=Meloidogyne graminicola TaxID=189291 RepID=A0A8S9ZNI1_9BILA|nr:Paired domain-containing protein [Meloidogyne graminicola]